jgi:hypothetical protein
MAMIQKPAPAANAAMYDKTQASGNLPGHLMARIHELMTAQKGATRSAKGRKPGYGTKQAAMVARGGAAPSPMSIMPGAAPMGN